MSYTSHGHWIPGTSKSDYTGDGTEKFCGGVRECDDCIKESAHVYYDLLNGNNKIVEEPAVQYVEVDLQVQHNKRMYSIGKALVDMDQLKKVEVEEDLPLSVVIASHFTFKED